MLTPSKPGDSGSAALRLLRHQHTRLKEALAILVSASQRPPDALIEALNGVEAEIDRAVNLMANDHIELLQLRAISKTWGMINSSLDLQTVITEAMQQIIELTGAERGYILWRKPDSEALEFRVACSIENDPSDKSFEISRTIVNRVIETAEPLLTDNASSDARMDNSASVAFFALRSVLCVPLKDREGVVVGVVYVANRLRAGVFTLRELNLMTAFSDQAAIAIENARLFTRVKTDLQKTKGELERLRIEVNHAQREQQVKDITDTDYFKDLSAKVREMRGQPPADDKPPSLP
jgi:hypothetical protein